MMSRISAIMFVILTTLLSACNISFSINDSSDTPSAATATPAPAYLPPESQTFEVMAATGWQDSHVLIRAGDRVTVLYVSGLWTQQANVVALHKAADSASYVCGRSDCVEIDPDAPQGTLVGRVGSQIVTIGNQATFIAQTTRYLALRMNDGDPGLYDNKGSVVVRIDVERVAT